jgi:hypothetical protein
VGDPFTASVRSAEVVYEVSKLDPRFGALNDPTKDGYLLYVTRDGEATWSRYDLN